MSNVYDKVYEITDDWIFNLIAAMSSKEFKKQWYGIAGY